MYDSLIPHGSEEPFIKRVFPNWFLYVGHKNSNVGFSNIINTDDKKKQNFHMFQMKKGKSGNTVSKLLRRWIRKIDLKKTPLSKV